MIDLHLVEMYKNAGEISALQSLVNTKEIEYNGRSELSDIGNSVTDDVSKNIYINHLGKEIIAARRR